jgi:hypothetical protein
MESLFALLFNVVITISSFLFSSSPSCLFFMDFPLSRTKHISKYSSIQKFMKLPFQRVVNHRKRSSNKGAMSVLLQRSCCPKLISGRVALGDSGITACRNLRLLRFLISWNRNFMGLLNIQKYPVFSLRDNSFSRIDPDMLTILIILYSRVSCCTSVLKIQGLPHA